MKSLFNKLALSFFVVTLAPAWSFAACAQPDQNSMDLQDSVAIDQKSGLLWQRCAVGMRWNNIRKQCDGRLRGLSHTEALDAAKRAGSGWRVPTLKELASLRVHSCNALKIDSRAFPNLGLADFGEGANYWTSTAATSKSTFYYVNFSDGSIDFHSQGLSLAVLLVRSQ